VSPDEIIVTAYAGNTPPTAIPGPDQSVAPGSRVALDGSASFDPDAGDGIAQYAWSFVAVPQGSTAALSPPTQVFPSPPLTAFVADVAGDYVIELVVTDHRGARSAPRRVLIQAGSPGALKPALTRWYPTGRSRVPVRWRSRSRACVSTRPPASSSVRRCSLRASSTPRA
jgi:hypothetical protein